MTHTADGDLRLGPAVGRERRESPRETVRPVDLAQGPETEPRRAIDTLTSTGVLTPKNVLPQTVVCAAFCQSWNIRGSPAPSSMRRGFAAPPPCTPSPMLKHTVA